MILGAIYAILIMNIQLLKADSGCRIIDHKEHPNDTESGGHIMNIVLVDDDRIYLDELREKVTQMCERNHINATISATDKPLSLLEKNIYNHYDVILLDIDMPHISGIELASEINKLKGLSERPYIIFVSGRDGLVFQALREQPFSFVRKSDIDDLVPCLKKISSRLSVENTYGIKSGRTVEKVLVREIVYLEKSGNYVIFHTLSGDIRERTTIDEKAPDLKLYAFIRTHISYLVNPLYIREVSINNVILTNGTVLPITKKLSKAVRQEFFEWMVNSK